MTVQLIRDRRPLPELGAVWRLILGAGLALVLASLAPSAAAQEEAAPELIGPASTITLEVSKGRVVRLPRPAATVFVADPEIADIQAQSPSIVYLFGRKSGETTIYAVDGEDNLLLRATLVVDHNLTGLRRALDRLLPENDVSVSSIGGSIVLEGLVESPIQALELRELAARYLGEEETLLNRVRVSAPTQVQLKVQVAEVSRAVIKDFGINWDALLQAGDFSFGLLSGSSIPGANSIFGNYTGSRGSVSAALDALAEENLINLLAEPNLTALSGETASFLAGGEFPIPIAAEENEVTIEFKQFGISLAFTPTVLSGQRISLKVRPEVSELSDNGAITVSGLTIPALATRRAETTVELGSGQSFMIGGLLSSNTRNTVNKFPGLGDLPVLGTLFRSQRFQRNETEVVIVVTPYLVRPVDKQRMATPTDGYKAPSDVERILEGRVYSARLQPGRSGPVGRDGRQLVGPVGFILD
jgi:pilus assembly protein CpaC